MARYIDREQAKEQILVNARIIQKPHLLSTEDTLYILDCLPTADVVEVVRCKECIYWNKRTVNNKGFIICSASGMEIHTEDFCSYGERKDT